MIYNIEKVWTATSKNSKLHNVYNVLLDVKQKEKVLKILGGNSKIRFKIEEQKSFSQRNKRSLIEGDPYFIEATKCSEDDLKSYGLDLLFKKIINDDNLSKSQTFSFKKEMLEYDSEKEIPKFFIISLKSGTNTYLLFSFINSRNLVRKKTLLDIDYLKVNKSSAIVEVNKGIPLPEDITSIYDSSEDILYVHETFTFDKMLSINEALKGVAEEKLAKFTSGVFTIGNENYKVDGLNDQVVKENIMNSARAVNRISKFEQKESNFEIKRIEKAMQEIEKEKKVLIDHKKRTLQVTQQNYKTFVAIIHDSIILRLISGETDII